MRKSSKMKEQSCFQARKAMMLSFIPGGGQFYNNQKFKGFIFLGIFLLFVMEMITFGISAIEGLVTLGSTPREDHSLFLLIKGAIQILILVFFLIFYASNIYDARKIAKKRFDGEKVSHTVKETFQSLFENGYPYILISFSYVAMIFAIIFPVLVTILTAFTNYDFKHIPPANLIDWNGIQTFLSIFKLNTYRETFFSVLSWTVVWTIGATTLQLVLGIFTAVVLNSSKIKMKRIIGVILLLPWAVPSFITIMSFSNIFNDSIGAINTQVIPFLNHLSLIDIPRIHWKTDPMWTKTALILIQGWLGYPYVFTLTSGILQSIPEEWYEASTMDGANALQKFRFITFPQIIKIAAPVFITQYTGNFNKFSVIYLFNDGGPGSVGAGAGSTDILVSWIYKLTTGGSPQYNVASAITLIISTVVVGISLILFKKIHAFDLE